MLAAVLGGAAGVWAELAEFERLLGRRPDCVVATNDAGVFYPGRLDVWVTLHPERFLEWRRRRAGNRTANQDYRVFLHGPAAGVEDAVIVPDRWAGSSGLYGAQIALTKVGACGVVLCGCPLAAERGHFFDRRPWTDAAVFRRGFETAFPAISGSVRSMSGWTRDLLGAPEARWLTDRAAAPSTLME